MQYTINVGGHLMDLGTPQVMGILNVTPDSFYAGSRKQTECEIAERSLKQADENRRVSHSQYVAGMESLSDHLEAQALWQQAWQTHVESRYQLYLKYVKYAKAAGRLN